MAGILGFAPNSEMSKHSSPNAMVHEWICLCTLRSSEFTFWNIHARNRESFHLRPPLTCRNSMQVSHSIPEGAQTPPATVSAHWALTELQSAGTVPSQLGWTGDKENVLLVHMYPGPHTPQGQCHYHRVQSGLHPKPGTAHLDTQNLSDDTCCCVCLACELSVNTHCSRYGKYRLWSIRDAARDCAAIKKHSQVHSLHCPWKPLKRMWKGGKSLIKAAQGSVLWTALDRDRRCSLGQAKWLWQTMGMSCREHSIAMRLW